MLRFVSRSQELAPEGGRRSRISVTAGNVDGGMRQHRVGVPGMIMTSYTSLVMESHRQSCAGLLSGVAGVFRRRQQEYGSLVPVRSQPAIIATLPQAPVLASETVDLDPQEYGRYRGAA